MGTQELIYTIISAAAVILAALIAGIVTLIVQSKQLKRDGKSIDEAKNAVSDMQPKVGSIHSSTETMKTSLIKIEERNSKIDSIATEIEVFKRIKSETAGSSIRPEALLASVQSVLEENAQLRKQNYDAQQRIIILTTENNRLQFRNQQLEAALKQQTPTPADDEWEP